MAKSSYAAIAEDRLALMRELQRNSNKGIDELAKSLGFSRQKVWRYMTYLNETKVIWGYTAIIDPATFGLKQFTVLIKGALPEILPEGIKIESICYINGFGYDWMITLLASDIAKAKAFCKKEETMILETLFTVQKQYIQNPDMKTDMVNPKQWRNLI
jgi:DNA-binding Lrp family transcriptional regulator